MIVAARLEQGRPSALIRIMVAAASMCLAAVAILDGLDRISAERPGVARRVPALFASEAHLARARIALESGDGKAALVEAEAAVDAAPLDPGSSATLGAARLALQQNRSAQSAFRIAGKLGWRIFFTQAYWMQRALAVGDYSVAAMRLDALARQDPALLRHHELLDPFEANPAGQAALAKRLAVAPWRVAYAADTSGLPPGMLAQRGLVLAELARQGTVLGCRTIAPAVSGLLDQRALVDASALWRSHCPDARSTLIYDGDFVAAITDDDRNDFAWSFIGQSDLAMVLTPADEGKGQQVAVDSTAQRRSLFLRQLLLVPPGIYRLSWRAQTADGNPSSAAVPLVFCEGAPETEVAGIHSPTADRWSGILTIDKACPAHWLGFAVRPGPSRFTLSSIRLAVER
ncbi:hypothetical protein [Novosphingobium sp.]|uniref:hypothetical protein n=1 Tax=Novosphingobium sp. TaxID=1874826 RepID=UPI0025CC7123|nr:hypothetical protein [Novosphingobium sp.]